MSNIPFIDLQAQQKRIRPQLDRAIQKVLNHGHYIMGPEVGELEKELSSFCGANHVITCANGTDALSLALMVYEIGPGDAVFVPSFTFAATAEVVCLRGATPVFVDVDKNTYNMDDQSLLRGLEVAKSKNLRPAGVIAVDLFGQPADYDRINAIASEHDLWVIDDAAQSFGATYKGRKVGTLADITTTSFFPAKPLGCYGDGGAIFTKDENIAHKLRSLRVHGQGEDKYDNVRIGTNSRLDTIQAAILLEKLKIFPSEIEARQRLANHYHEQLKGKVKTPILLEGCTSTWAQYTVQCSDGSSREAMRQSWEKQGIPTVVYYAKPLHQQKAYQDYPRSGDLCISGALSSTVLSLPMHGYASVSLHEVFSF